MKASDWKLAYMNFNILALLSDECNSVVHLVLHPSQGYKLPSPLNKGFLSGMSITACQIKYQG